VHNDPDDPPDAGGAARACGTALAGAGAPAVNAAQPDVTLFLDAQGVIRDASLSEALSEEALEEWIGQPWAETVTDAGSDKVRRMLEDAAVHRVSVFRQLTQRFPSGRELLMEYTTVRLGGNAGLVAVGKNLQTVADLQSRLIEAQQNMERDYWKLREVETRYRLLFNASKEAVLLVDADSLRIMEANPAALTALGGPSPARAWKAGARELLSEVMPQDRERLQAMLQRVREQGKAPAMMVHLAESEKPCLMRASLMTSEPGPVFMLQLAPAEPAQPAPDHEPEPVSVASLVERGPDGFVVVDREGTVVRANRAFLDLIQAGAAGSVLGERLGRWLGRPGADLTVLLANVRRYGVVRLFSTSIRGEHGAETEVEISAVGDADAEPRYVGLLMRDVSRRLRAAYEGGRVESVVGVLTEQVGKSPLRQLVRETVGAVERHYIEAALELTGGNRTAAAELLGLSRQSLYAKLNRYGLDGGSANAVGAQ